MLVNLDSRVMVSRLMPEVPVVQIWTIVSIAPVVLTRIQIFVSVALRQLAKRLQDHMNAFAIQLVISPTVLIASMRMSA